MQRHSTLLRKEEVEAIAIGGFDGIHRGHRQLIKRLGDKGALLVIDKDQANLTPGVKRSEYSKHPCMFYHFLKVKDLSGEEFVHLLRREFPRLKKIVIGYDFQFGKKRSCDGADLKHMFDGDVEIVSEYFYDGISVHSTTIRGMIQEGDIHQANRLLGREYAMIGDVVPGQGLGRKALYPTLNLQVKHYLLPKEGVYATRTMVGQMIYDSVSFVGKRVSTDNQFSVETHILEETVLEPVRHVELFFVEYLRENRRFEELSALKSQITEDIKRAKGVLTACTIHLDDALAGKFTYL